MKRGRWLVPVFSIAILAHAESLSYWFVASDTLPLIATSRVAHLSDLGGLFVQPLMYGSDFVRTGLFYRPISSLTYAFDYWLWGLDPFGYHLTNVVLHGVAAVLVADAITEITDRSAVGVLTAVLFAIHPLTGEVVPTAARRQDILLLIFVLGTLGLFVRWYRHSNQVGTGQAAGWRPYPVLVGSLVAYALALGSKETAIVVPGLLLAWVVIGSDTDRPVRAVKTSIHSVSPFFVATLGYLIVRVAALGGLGGYRVEASILPAHFFEKVVFLAAKYLIWTIDPRYFARHVVAAVSTDPSGVLLLGVFVLVCGVVSVFWLVRDGYFAHERFVGLRILSPVGCIVGFAVVPVLVWLPWATLFTSTAPTVLSSYVVEVLFIGGCIAGVLTALLMANALVGHELRRQLVFFGCWFVLPLCILLSSGFVLGKPLEFGFGMRNGYLALVPVMAGVSLLLVTAVRTLKSTMNEHSRTDSDVRAAVVLAVFVLFLLVPAVATSPLLHSDGGWGAASELNQQSLEGLSDELDAVPAADLVYIADFPHEFDEHRRPYPHARSVSPLRPYSIEAWLELQDPQRDAQVRLVRRKTVAEVPTRISFHVEKRNGWLAVWTKTAETDAAANGSEAT